MEANTTTASPVIPATSQMSQGRMTESVQSRGDGGDSSTAFSQRTNVSIETAIDHMADVLSKVSDRQQSNVQQMPQELKEVIQNMIRQSFSLETTLGQGLGSTAASQRFSTDQLTTLSRMLNQLGTMAETGSMPQVSDDLAALLTGLKTALAKEAGGTFEPIMLTKAAFQLLDTGNPELLPKELQTFLADLNPQGNAQTSPFGGRGTTSLTFLNQLVQLMMPRDEGSVSQQLPHGMENTAAQQFRPGGTVQPVPQNPAGAQETGGSSPAPNTMTSISEEAASEQQMSRTQISPSAAAAAEKDNTAVPLRQTETMSQGNTGNIREVPVPSNPSAAQGTSSSFNEKVEVRNFPADELPQVTQSSERGQSPAPSTGNTKNTAQIAKDATTPMQRQAEQQIPAENRPAPEAGARMQPHVQAQTTKSNPQGATTAQSVRTQGGSEAELPPAPHTSTQSTVQMKSSEIQSAIPRYFTQTLENTPQTMNVLRNLAQTLLQNENLSPKETLLLQNFVSGRGQTLSEGDAKQLQELIRLTQQNIPGTVRQAAFEQQMPDLPRLWAFMQMADIVKTRRMTAEQYKRAGRDVASLALTMRNALEGENFAPQPGQRSMNFVMPLFMGASEYPAYIHVYDEAHRDEETNLVKKETWLRICVLTDNIGTVELINRIYEENHVDMRLYFSDADAAWEFRHALDEIRESADGTALVIEGIQIGAIGERRFFTN
ncbi:hypothetical protein [Selenomonas dianae]|nr:hypothetical protein [Selenomonas dianae]WLD83514.1 hypothetical protein QU667_04505 [Selenomonas dianae]